MLHAATMPAAAGPNSTAASAIGRNDTDISTVADTRGANRSAIAVTAASTIVTGQLGTPVCTIATPMAENGQRGLCSDVDSKLQCLGVGGWERHVVTT